MVDQRSSFCGTSIALPTLIDAQLQSGCAAVELWSLGWSLPLPETATGRRSARPRERARDSDSVSVNRLLRADCHPARPLRTHSILACASAGRVLVGASGFTTLFEVGVDGGLEQNASLVQHARNVRYSWIRISDMTHFPARGVSGVAQRGPPRITMSAEPMFVQMQGFRPKFAKLVRCLGWCYSMWDIRTGQRTCERSRETAQGMNASA